MKHLPSLRPLGVLSAAILLAQFSPLAHAYSTATASDGTSQSTYDSLISNTGDLLYGLTPSSTQPADQVGGFNFSVNGINDGAATNGAPGTHDTYFQGAAPFSPTSNLNNDPVVTYTFDTSVNTRGYTITSLQSIYGWQDNQSFSDQDYTITYKLVGNSTTFTLGSVAFNPFVPDRYPSEGGSYNGGGAPDSSWVDLTGINLSGVSSISFQFTPYTAPGGLKQGAQLIREIDVFGAATVPEPATWAMLLLGGFAFLAALTWRRGFA
jgi:hypothetical protein